MGKPYDHTYHLLSSSHCVGNMVCRKCNQPINEHTQHWMSYKKSKSYDWAYHCFHRDCCEDQAGWIRQETRITQENASLSKTMSILANAASDIGVTDPYEFARLAALSLGGGELSTYYFDLYGSS